jgi:ribosomal protein S9
MDFRFLCDLKEINIPSSSLFPSDSGHELVSVEFIHEPDCVVKPADGLASSIQTKPEDGKTILTIPPKAAYDASRWRVGPPNGTRIDVTVLVERVWWAISGESNEPSEWGDKVFTLSREDFFPTSDKTLWLRFPKRRWTDRVLVGFDRSKARDYPVKVAEETVAIPLRNFESSQEVGDRTQQHRFKVWIERREGVIAVIPALHYWVGVGRSKAAKAEAVLREGHRGISVKGEPIEGYFQRTQPEDKRYLLRLLRLKGLQTAFSQLEGDVTVERGTPCGRRQAKAVAHALVQALAKRNPELKPLLQHKGFWRNSKKRG